LKGDETGTGDIGEFDGASPFNACPPY
jgi:hypothetical protein